MARFWRVHWILGLGLVVMGLAIGLSISGLWPKSPLHATATDRYEKFALATGFVQESVEAVFVLDHLTGELQAFVLGRFSGKFQAGYRTNVIDDLNRLLMAQKAAVGGAARPRPGEAAEPPPVALITAKDASFMIVTGVADFRQQRAGQLEYASGVLYVFEAETGWLIAYGIFPWNRAFFTAGRDQPPGNLVPLDIRRVRAVQG